MVHVSPCIEESQSHCVPVGLGQVSTEIVEAWVADFCLYHLHQPSGHECSGREVWWRIRIPEKLFKQYEGVLARRRQHCTAPGRYTFLAGYLVQDS